MGIFDNNIHMNGSGTTYQAFLDLANAAENKDGMLGDRTVRLVKAGDGLATTTSLGTKGARADQIAGARDAFLLAIAREYGYAARDIAAKTLGDAMQASTDKSSELQNQNKDGLDKLQQMAIGLEARHWSSATACTMQLQQAIAKSKMEWD